MRPVLELFPLEDPLLGSCFLACLVATLLGLAVARLSSSAAIFNLRVTSAQSVASIAG